MPRSFGLPPVVNCRGTRPSQAARSRPRSKLSACPMAAIKSGCDDRSDAGDRGQTASLFVVFHPADELRIESRYPSIELGPLRPSVGDEQDHSRAQTGSAL